ncbi:DJ-1/PfpI/YhbO family deglycase/protease [Thermodesulfatator atlanticus]
MKKFLLIFSLLLFLIPFLETAVFAKDSPKVAIVIAQHGFREEELFEPKKILEKHGFQVDVVSIKQGKATGMFGTEIQVSKTLSDINPNKYLALLIAGGVGAPKYLWGNKTLISLVKEFYKENKVVGAICLSPVVLAQAGILKGKKATCWPAEAAIKELKKYGAIYDPRGVIVQGKIITAKSPDYAKEFAKEILRLLQRR